MNANQDSRYEQSSNAAIYRLRRSLADLNRRIKELDNPAPAPTVEFLFERRVLEKEDLTDEYKPFFNQTEIIDFQRYRNRTGDTPEERINHFKEEMRKKKYSDAWQAFLEQWEKHNTQEPHGSAKHLLSLLSETNDSEKNHLEALHYLIDIYVHSPFRGFVSSALWDHRFSDGLSNREKHRFYLVNSTLVHSNFESNRIGTVDITPFGGDAKAKSRSKKVSQTPPRFFDEGIRTEFTGLFLDQIQKTVWTYWNRSKNGSDKDEADYNLLVIPLYEQNHDQSGGFLGWLYAGFDKNQLTAVLSKDEGESWRNLGNKVGLTGVWKNFVVEQLPPLLDLFARDLLNGELKEALLREMDAETEVLEFVKDNVCRFGGWVNSKEEPSTVSNGLFQALDNEKTGRKDLEINLSRVWPGEESDESDECIRLSLRRDTSLPENHTNESAEENPYFEDIAHKVRDFYRQVQNKSADSQFSFALAMRLLVPAGLIEKSDKSSLENAFSALGGRPDILFFDPIGAPGAQKNNEWKSKLEKKGFNITNCTLPITKSSGDNWERLLGVIQYEIQRLPRPIAAIIQTHASDADRNESENPTPGELKRLIETARPTLPVFVLFPRGINKLDGDRLWSSIYATEFDRYDPPPLGMPGGNFIVATTPGAQRNRQAFLKQFAMNEADLRKENPHGILRLLRALVPRAEAIEILMLLGKGRSGAERPFIVRGRTAEGRWLRPVQIKLSRDWRALARERKGYRDVFRSAMGPSIAHCVEGPYQVDSEGRIGSEPWSGMAQSFAAPEEAITNLSTRSTQTFGEYLKARLGDPDSCRKLVHAVFDGVLKPFYGEHLATREESVHRAYVRVTPAHFQACFQKENESNPSPKTISFHPDDLSRKNERARREEAYRRWRTVDQNVRKGNEGRQVRIDGLVVDTLECDDRSPLNSRLRVCERTLGVKVDLFPKDDETASNWKQVADSPIKVRGLPISFVLDPADDDLRSLVISNEDMVLLGGWRREIEGKLRESGILASNDGELTDIRSKRVLHYLQNWHPLDWSEEFTVGPTHGDLNLGNILINERKGEFFPWLIDFDKAENDQPIVFDLAKLEIEAYHTVGHWLFSDLWRHGFFSSPESLSQFVQDFERCLESEHVASLDHLWDKGRGDLAAGTNDQGARKPHPPRELRIRLNGFFAYLKTVHERIRDLGVQDREFLVGRAVYCLCVLKFKHLYQCGDHENAPFPARILYYKLQCLLEKLDELNGIHTPDIYSESNGLYSKQQAVVAALVAAIRESRKESPSFFGQVLSDPKLEECFKALRSQPPYDGDLSKVKVSVSTSDTESNPFYNVFNGDASNKEPKEVVQCYETIFRLLRDSQIPGDRYWFREMLWYIRDFGVGNPEELCSLTLGMVLGSMKAQEWFTLEFYTNRRDYASTGRIANAYPSRSFFEHLAESKGPLAKISSRGESGGTIDILESAGIRICQSRETVRAELNEKRWAVAETSTDLCEVDRIMMALRKGCNCMKVDDLVIASISAKKLALGIGRFEVQVVKGYDSKFQGLKSADSSEKAPLQALQAKWQETWKGIWNLLVPDHRESQSNNNPLKITGDTAFDSDKLESWFEEIPGLDKPDEVVVCGSVVLAANIWTKFKSDPDSRRKLKNKHLSRFIKEIETLSEPLETIKRVSDREGPEVFKVELPESNPDGNPKAIEVKRIQFQSTSDISSRLADMTGLLFTYNGYDNIKYPKFVRVEFFDGLYSKIQSSNHPMTSIIFGREFVCILRPTAEIPDDLLSWSWQVLREGFEIPAPAGH